ncbi:MAG: alpha/beta hydrolase [Myxococcota bacterium]
MLYVRDGTRIAWRLTGPRARGGAPGRERIVLCDGISCDGFIWRDLLPVLERDHDVLHVNYRGHGRSGLPRDLTTATLPFLVGDLLEVMDEVGFADAVFMGHSLGVQVSLEAAIRAPERVRGLVLLNGSHGRVLDTFAHTDIGAKVLPIFDRLAQRFRGAVSTVVRGFLGSPAAYMLAALTEIKGDRIKPKDFQPYLDHFARMPLDLFATLLADASERTALPELPRLAVPALVMAGQDDGFTPIAVSKVLAQTLPAARLVVVPGTSHTAPLEAPEAFASAIGAFLDELPAAASEAARAAVPTAWPRWA